MKTITLILLLSVLALGATYQPQAKSWEYRFVYQCDEKKTNTAAADGWELSEMSMAAYGSQGIATCVFKRVK